MNKDFVYGEMKTKLSDVYIFFYDEDVELLLGVFFDEEGKNSFFKLFDVFLEECVVMIVVCFFVEVEIVRSFGCIINRGVAMMANSM